jgi:hypothetical protein
MKKHLLALIAVLVLGTAVMANNGTDSLFITRSLLYYRYLDIKNNTDNFSRADEDRLTKVMEQLVLFDNRVMDSLKLRIARTDTLQQRLLQTDQELQAAHMKKGREQLHWVLLCAGGALFFALMIVFLVLYLRARPGRNKA